MRVTCDCSTRRFEVFQYYSKASYLREDREGSNLRPSLNLFIIYAE